MFYTYDCSLFIFVFVFMLQQVFVSSMYLPVVLRCLRSPLVHDMSNTTHMVVYMHIWIDHCTFWLKFVQQLGGNKNPASVRFRIQNTKRIQRHAADSWTKRSTTTSSQQIKVGPIVT